MKKQSLLLVIGIIVIISTISLSVVKKNNKQTVSRDNTPTRAILSPTTVILSPTITIVTDRPLDPTGWITFTNVKAKYSLIYPKDAQVYKDKEFVSDGMSIDRNNMDTFLVSRFQINILHKNISKDMKLNDFIKNESICPEVKENTGIDYELSGIHGRRYEYVECTPHKVIIYAVNNGIGYTILVKSLGSLKVYKSNLDQVLSTFRFIK